MLEAKATWKGGYKFLGTDSSGRTLKMDASVGAGGEGDGFRPAELPLMGLVGCTGIDTMEILQKMRQPVEGIEVTARAEKADGYPAQYKEVVIEYVVRGKGLSADKVEQAVELSEEKYCTVGGALRNPTRISHRIDIVDD